MPILHTGLSPITWLYYAINNFYWQYHLYAFILHVYLYSHKKCSYIILLIFCYSEIPLNVSPISKLCYRRRCLTLIWFGSDVERGLFINVGVWGVVSVWVLTWLVCSQFMNGSQFKPDWTRHQPANSFDASGKFFSHVALPKKGKVMLFFTGTDKIMDVIF